MYKALIIDDIALVRDAIRILGQWDVFEISEIYEAGNARDGLNIIQEKQPDIIITDMKMPVMDGPALLTYMENEHIPGKIIVISGFSDFSYMRTAIRSGAVDYILKPIDPQDLNNALAAAVAQLEQEGSQKNAESPMEANRLAEQKTSMQTPTPSAASPVIQEVLAYIEQNYRSELTLSDLADRFYVSKEHLSRLFKKETGQNLFSYIIERKLLEGRRLLTETDSTLDDIAYSLGFSNGNYFSKVFKKNVGISPSSYRAAPPRFPDLP